MTAAKRPYNGHPSYNLWNVALWFGNDEGLYNMARQAIRHYGSRDKAAEAICAELHEAGIVKTPDGAPYSKTSIRHALRGL